MSYFVTGATGFIGRHLVERLLEREGDIYVLVREESAGKLDRWRDSDRVKPVFGDLTQPGLGLDDEARERLRGVDHVFHLGAVYDIAAPEEQNSAVNVGGTQNVVDLANELGAGRFHHLSSIAVAGDYDGHFTEDDFAEGQGFPNPYHRTKFESEKLVRERVQGRWRVYRPSLVVGNSQTGEMDKIDGPYYFFKAIQKLRHALPEWFPLVSLEFGRTNLVPVDYVAAAVDHIAHQEGLDGQAFHIVDAKPPKSGDVLNTFANAAHAPHAVMRLDKRMTDMLPKGVLSYAMKIPALQGIKRSFLADLGIPEEAIQNAELRTRFDARDTQRALAGSGIELPKLETYAEKLWDYWERNLDPDLFKDRSFEGAVNGRTVVITGASSGIGRAAALKIAAAGGIPLLVARTQEKLDEVKAEIEAAGGTAYVYSCDLSDYDAIEELVGRMLSDHPAIDVLVNNAGRSIRRSVSLSYDRFHDYERTVGLNYLLTREAHAGAAAAHARAGLGPRGQRVLDRRTDQPAALLGLRGLQVGARRVHARGLLGDDRRRRDVHHDPHAFGTDADDRADEDLRLVPDHLAGRGGRHHLRGDPGEAEADQHAARDVRRGRLRPGAQGRRPDPAHGLQGVPGVGRGEREEGRGREGLGRGDGARLPDARRPLVTGDHVTVTGSARRALAPGAATWRAETVETDDDPRAAFERCSGRLNALVERLAAVGEVASEAVVVEPRFEERGPAGTEAIGAVRVRTSAARAGEVAQAAMAAGANRLHGPWFEYEGAEAAQVSLLGDAVADARRKAERLAAAAERRLGPVRAVEEQPDDRHAVAALVTSGAPDVRPREQIVTAVVRVVFALQD